MRADLSTIDLERSVAIPFPLVQALLTTHPTVVVEPHATIDDRRRGQVRTELRVPLGHTTVVREVVVDVAPPSVHGTELVLPLRWQAASASRWFPRMEAALAVEEAGYGSSRFRLTGHCTVPFRFVGRLFHRITGERFADASVATFFDQAIEHVTAGTAHGRESFSWRPAASPYAINGR